MKAIDELAGMIPPDSANPSYGGTQLIYIFENGYRASVVQTPYSYGWDNNRMELAVLDDKNRINYKTPITEGTTGVRVNLDVNEVIELLGQIDELPMYDEMLDAEYPENLDLSVD